MPEVSDILGESAGQYITDNVAISALNGVLMLFQARGYKVGTFTVSPAVGATLPSAGAIIVEQHNDPDYAGTWSPVPSWDPGTTAPVASTTAITVTAALNRQFEPSMQWVRIRVSTALTARPATPFIRLVLCTEPHAFPLALGTGSQIVVGAGAEDAAATGNPVLAAGVVRTANLASLVAGDNARHTMTTSAQLLVKDGHLPELDWNYAAASGGIVNTTDVAAKAAAGAGLRNFVYSMTLKNVNAVAGEFVVKDGAAVMWRGHLSANQVNGEEVVFRPPLKGTANTAVNIACITTGQQVYANLQGGVGL